MAYTKWLTPGIGIKRWITLIITGIVSLSAGFANMTLLLQPSHSAIFHFSWFTTGLLIGIGIIAVGFGQYMLVKNMLAPYRRYRNGRVVDVVYAHSRRAKGVRLVAIGGGTGLPSVLRGMKVYTNNITAIVTVADDGGSSGQLRRDFGIIAPGDLRNNIAALAEDESLLTKLFQFRFHGGNLGGHAFGNLFIAALTNVTGSMEYALEEVERVLNLKGRVYPSTLDNLQLTATIRLKNAAKTIEVRGESKITASGGQIERLSILPTDALAFPASLQAIHDAEVIVLGPGSLYTSILPNLLIPAILEAIKTSPAHKVYVCNIATQPGETDNYTVADHITALEKHIGRGLFQTVIANHHYPTENAGGNTRYVAPAPPDHTVHQRYHIAYVDLTDPQYPWRHDPHKLARALLKYADSARIDSNSIADPIFSFH